MKKLLFISFSLILTLSVAKAQSLYIDPATSAAMATHASVISGGLNNTNNKLGAIGTGQAAIAAELAIANQMQQQIYNGLSQVNAVINNLLGVKEIADCGIDIMNYIGKAAALAKSDPLTLLLAQKSANIFYQQAALLTTEVTSFVQAGGKNNLMDSGERSRILNHIVERMQILRGAAYGIENAIYWAHVNGVFHSLNPFAGYVNHDKQISADIMRKVKFLKQ
ncbi:hypothetical protein [Mucilaginibacter lappiensis]|uniref:Uncharacterized protein n=1 Tax=Mucilaginibacter lappiensis TaxID=354630 RepID=A0A841JPI8_9SPHI|nr:hypothetical protein [Mucilaginibacter lappiensis]MBB6131516.1 hypothetical protein [Mucilaginibacter lappiensis]